MKKTIKVNSDYDIIFDDNLIEEIEKFIDDEHKCNKVLIIKDTNVDKLYSDIRFSNKKKVYSFVVDAGEKSKSISTYYDLVNFMAINNIDRHDLILAFGGGVIGDLSGFLASTYMRSTDYIQIPTTLLAMVDSSVGSKTAINTDEVKNLIGSFYDPLRVYINYNFLKTLPKVELINGMAEVIKYAFIYDKDLYSYLFNEDCYKLHNLKNIVYRCIQIKKEIVEQDREEYGIRKILNFGHTIGHAIERASDFEIKHGYAVAMGMVYMTKVFSNDGPEYLDILKKLVQILDKYGLYTECDYEVEDLKEIIFNDKKSSGELIEIVKVESLGSATIVGLEKNKLVEMMKV